MGVHSIQIIPAGIGKPFEYTSIFYSLESSLNALVGEIKVGLEGNTLAIFETFGPRRSFGIDGGDEYQEFRNHDLKNDRINHKVSF